MTRRHLFGLIPLPLGLSLAGAADPSRRSTLILPASLRSPAVLTAGGHAEAERERAEARSLLAAYREAWAVHDATADWLIKAHAPGELARRYVRFKETRTPCQTAGQDLIRLILRGHGLDRTAYAPGPLSLLAEGHLITIGGDPCFPDTLSVIEIGAAKML